LIDDLLKYKRLDGVDQALRSLVQNLVEGDKSAVDMTGALASFGGPAVAVWGREDQIVPAANAAGLGNAATVHIVDGVGHVAHLEKPQAVAAAIREALGAGGIGCAGDGSTRREAVGWVGGMNHRIAGEINGRAFK